MALFMTDDTNCDVSAPIEQSPLYSLAEGMRCARRRRMGDLRRTVVRSGNVPATMFPIKPPNGTRLAGKVRFHGTNRRSGERRTSMADVHDLLRRDAEAVTKGAQSAGAKRPIMIFRGVNVERYRKLFAMSLAAKGLLLLRKWTSCSVGPRPIRCAIRVTKPVHPRVRGDDQYDWTAAMFANGSPPRAGHVPGSV